MPANHPNPRPAAGGLLIALLLVGLLTPAASANEYTVNELPYNHTYNAQTYEGYTASNTISGTTSSSGSAYFYLYIANVENYPNLHYTRFILNSGDIAFQDGQHAFKYKNPADNAVQDGYYICHKYTDIAGTVVKTDVVFFYPSWSIGTRTGAYTEKLLDESGAELVIGSYTKLYSNIGSTVDGDEAFRAGHYPSRFASVVNWTTSAEAYFNSKYAISIEEDTTTIPDEFKSCNINLTRQFDGSSYQSNFAVYDSMDNLIVGSNTALDADYQIYLSELSKINVSTATYENTYTVDFLGGITPETPQSSVVSVYVMSSQTGALLANANLAILASAGGTEIEIINATLPAGTATYTLQPTGGGLPNPDYYRAYATVPGYSQIIENHSFTLTGPHDVIIEMRPDSGGPTDPENCYLEFYVRDLNANSIPSASIQCNNQFKQTNSAGYAVFEVAKNASYPYVVKKSGYVTIEGSVTVADGPRYIANIVLGPGSVPTYTPTPDPSTGETPGATPTPDTRTNEQKGQEVIDLLADFALPIAILAILATLSGLLSMMMPRRR